MEPTKFGKLLTRLREEQRYSMNALADAAKVSVAHVSRIEAGERPNPSARFIKKISNVIGHYDELMEAAGYLDEANCFGQTVPNSEDMLINDLLKQVQQLTPEQVEAFIKLAQSINNQAANDKPKSKIRFKKSAPSAPKEDPVAKLPYWYMRLTALRQERGLSLEEAAKQMGGYMTPDILRSYEKGKAMPDPADQELMSDFYETNWFFISGRVNVRRGYAGETTVAIDAADNEDHPNEPLSYEKRKQLKDVYEKLGLVYDLEEDEENN